MNTECCLRAAAICGVLGLFGCLASPAPASFFDVFGASVTQGPPYPSMPPITVHVTDDNSPPRTAMIEDISFAFSAGLDGVPMDARVIDTGGGEGSPGTTLSSEYYQLSSEPPPTTQIESFFDVFAPVGLTALAIPGPVSYADSFFDVFFDVQFSDGGIMSHHLHGQIPTGQDLALTNVSGVMVAARPDRQIVRYEWSFHGRPDALLPVMIVELTGSYVPEPATLVLMLLGVIGTAALWDVGHWCKSQRRRRVGHGGTRHLPWRTPNIRIK